MVALLLSVMGANATEYDLDISSLSGETYNSSTHEFTFGTSWKENQWWIGETNPLDISGYGEFIVEYTGATSASKFRVYLEPVSGSGTTQTVYPTANTSFGRSVIKLASGLNNIKKIVISDAGTAFNMTLTRAYFRSKSSKSATTLWTGSTALGNWTDITDLTSDGDGKTALKSAKVDDVIRVTFTNAASDNQINVRNSSYNDFIDGTFSEFTVQGDAQTAEYVIPNAEVLESIQLNGIIVSGKNATVTKMELLTYTESYDACMVTIGSDEIATFSTGSKKLNFTDTGIIPYYASTVESGKVTLTAVSDKTTWGYQGYILKGNAGTYEVPATEEATYQETDYLKATGDYSANVTRSTDGTYHYIFAKKEGEDPAFYKLAEGYYRTTTEQEGDIPSGTIVYYHKLAAHKAYLETTTPAASRVAPVFDDGETTGIQELENTSIEELNHSGNEALKAYYNLNGQRVTNPKRGLYIVNGKKVIIK